MSTSNKSLAILVSAYFKAVGVATERRAAMKPELDKLSDRAERIAALTPLYARNMGIPLTNEDKPEGGKDGANWKAWCAAKSRVQRDVSALYGDEGKSGTGGRAKESFEVPADIAALAAKLVAMCNKYENAKSLAAQAVAEAFAAK